MSLIGIIAAIIAFGVLVLIHELGHFLAARWMGVRVEKFSIGFPPKIISKKIGDTEFSLSAIPLGGYVKMAGFIDESMDSKITGADYEYSSKPVWKRMIIITAGVTMNLLLAIVIYTAIIYNQGELRNPTTKVTVTGESGVAEKIGFQDGDEVLAINDRKIEYWEELQLAFFENIENDVIFKIQRGADIKQLVYKKEWLAEKKGELLDLSPVNPASVGDVVTDMPASEIGLQRGDKILELNGISVGSWGDMTKIIRENPEKKVEIKWQRGNKIIESSIIPKKVTAQDEQGNEISIGQIGIGYNYVHKQVPFTEAVIKGIVQPFKVIYMNIIGFKWVLSGIKSAEESFAGPGTIVKMIGDAADRGWVFYFSLLGLLNAVLAFFNMLPIPGLDGGHFAFLLVEGIMRRPLSVKTRLVVQQVGLAILLSLIVFVIYIDINRFL